MENPYWHPEQKSHVVNTDDVRLLAFSVFNIVRASMSMMGAGIELDVEKDQLPTLMEILHYEYAEHQLSKNLLQIAVLMRTLDDYWSDLGHEIYSDNVKRINKENRVGLIENGDKSCELSLREACNKIIHAQDFRPVYDTEDDRDAPNSRWGMDSQIEMRGAQRGLTWTATLNAFQFLEAVIDLVDIVDDLKS
jgi:hypothetical protein